MVYCTHLTFLHTKHIRISAVPFAHATHPNRVGTVLDRIEAFNAPVASGVSCRLCRPPGGGVSSGFSARERASPPQPGILSGGLEEQGGKPRKRSIVFGDGGDIREVRHVSGCLFLFPLDFFLALQKKKGLFFRLLTFVCS